MFTRGICILIACGFAGATGASAAYEYPASIIVTLMVCTMAAAMLGAYVSDEDGAIR